MAELQLILTTPIEELIPSNIEWNNEILKELVSKQLVVYKGKNYDDDSIAEAKADRARLNNFTKYIDGERLRIKKEYMQPCERFETEVKEVMRIVGEVSGTIDVIVKDYEQRRKDEKQAAIIEYFDNNIGDLKDFISYDKIHSEKWLNSTTSHKVIAAEIDERINRIRNELLTIRALKSESEAALMAYYFRNLSLSDALREDARIREETKRIEEANRIAEAKIQTEQLKTESVPATSVPTEEILTVKFEVSGSREQLKLLKQFLTQNQIIYKSY